jgi:intracellular sulfur oxidation DsrE/DsrF family protein
MKKWLLLLSLSMLLNAGDGSKKVVFDLTLGDQKGFERNVLSGTVKNKDYYEGNMQELDVAVVIHGNANKFFVKNLSTTPYKKERELLSVQESFEKRLRSLANNYNVKFYICQAGLSQLKIANDNIYDFVTVVETSTIGLIDRQSEGYSYVPIQ